ncbi:MAG TPA: hypothetical protein VMV28_05845 [Thermoplasmata archaeon]|nr:hypothetical protein [Thermoplasmata archaeon]
MPESVSPSTTWGECAFCGNAVPPTSAVCPICGAGEPVRAGTIARAPRRVQRRLKLLGAFRILIVAGVVVVLAFLVIQPVLSGPPVLADPLTTSGTYTIGAGNSTVLAGEVSGEDFITGNFSVVAPVGTTIGLTVYNTTEYSQFLAGDNPQNQTWYSPGNSGPITFAAYYTDTYYFVFSNPYPTTSGITVTVYIATQYQTNVNSFA